MKNEPQLPAEMERRFDEEFPNEESGYLNKQGEYVHLFNPAVDSREIKTFLATALADERQRCISIVKNFIDSILENNTGSLEELLNKLKGE